MGRVGLLVDPGIDRLQCGHALKRHTAGQDERSGVLMRLPTMHFTHSASACYIQELESDSHIELELYNNYELETLLSLSFIVIDEFPPGVET